jgi:hypothetical protein
MTSEDMHEKALRLVDENRVIAGRSDQAIVVGDHGGYIVTAYEGGLVGCTCPARRGNCAHRLASMVAWSEMGDSPEAA